MVLFRLMCTTFASLLGLLKPICLPHRRFCYWVKKTHQIHFRPSDKIVRHGGMRVLVRITETRILHTSVKSFIGEVINNLVSLTETRMLHTSVKSFIDEVINNLVSPRQRQKHDEVINNLVSPRSRQKQVPFIMAVIENVEFMHDFCPQHLSGNSKMKETEAGKNEYGKKQCGHE